MTVRFEIGTSEATSHSVLKLLTFRTIQRLNELSRKIRGLPSLKQFRCEQNGTLVQKLGTIFKHRKGDWAG